VFASPHRLKLQLLCTIKNPLQKTLDIWPELPIVIGGDLIMSTPHSKPWYANNIIAALKQHDRVAKIDMNEIPRSLLTRLRATEMRDPFSALTSLRLHSSLDAPALPDSFLGGSTPRLQTLSLCGIPFPALPSLLLSTRDLVELRLWNIPLFGHISPDAMVTCLSALTRLKSLVLTFQSPRSRADRENRLVLRLTRPVLPTLTSFNFAGDTEYLEHIVGQIDTPLLAQFKITFFHQLVYDTPLLHRFIGRTEMFKAHRAELIFGACEVEAKLYPRNDDEISSLAICKPFDWSLSSVGVAQVCDLALSTLPTLDLEHLKIRIVLGWDDDDVENAQWVALLHPFTSIKDLILCDESIQRVALALEELAGERLTEALPTLQNLFLSGPQPSDPVKKAIWKFVAARQLSGRPVAVHHRDWPKLAWQQMHWEVGD